MQQMAKEHQVLMQRTIKDPQDLAKMPILQRRQASKTHLTSQVILPPVPKKPALNLVLRLQLVDLEHRLWSIVLQEELPQDRASKNQQLKPLRQPS